MTEKQFKALVVDDEPELREILSEALDEEGFEVCCASNGTEAFAMTQQTDFDIVLTDIRMPGGDGVSLLQKIRQNSPRKPLVFLLSGFSDLPIEDAFAAGANAFISKPYALKDVVERAKLKLRLPEEAWTRSHPRLPVQSVVSLEAQNLESALEGRLINIGLGGAFIHCSDKQLPIPSPALTEFVLKFTDGPISTLSITGIVRWVRSVPEMGQPIGFGLEFVDLNDECRERVKQIIEHLSGPEVIPKK